MAINIFVSIPNMYIFGNVLNVKEKCVLITYFIAERTRRAKEENLLLEEKFPTEPCHAAFTAN